MVRFNNSTAHELSLYLTMLHSAQLCKHICGLCVLSWLALLTPASVEAQRRGVTLTGTVNETRRSFDRTEFES